MVAERHLFGFRWSGGRGHWRSLWRTMR
jgi:hypothetical protein